MKNYFKTHKKRLAAGFLRDVIYGVLRMLRATMRLRIIGGEIPQAFHDRGEGTINVFWHGRLILMPYAYTGKDLHILVSSHGDGEIIANLVRSFGFNLVRGSSSKRGKEALQEMVQLARENRDLAITPDGPRGPAEVVKPGVASLASLTGKPVIPLAFSCSRGKRFSSWDRFLLPYPFSQGVIVWGEPLFCNEGEHPEAFRQRIEKALRDTTAKADGYFSR